MKAMSKQDEISKCVLCGGDYKGYGNNPEPVKPYSDGQCCDKCNWEVVLPARGIPLDVLGLADFCANKNC